MNRLGNPENKNSTVKNKILNMTGISRKINCYLHGACIYVDF